MYIWRDTQACIFISSEPLFENTEEPEKKVENLKLCLKLCCSMLSVCCILCCIVCCVVLPYFAREESQKSQSRIKCLLCMHDSHLHTITHTHTFV